MKQAIILTVLSFCSIQAGLAKNLTLDEQVHTLVNPVRSGLVSSSSAFKEQYPTALKLLKLPAKTKGEKFVAVVESRLLTYKQENKQLETPRGEALAVLNEPKESKIPDLALKERLSLVSSCVQNFKSIDSRHLHSEASDGPSFSLLSAPVKSIDQ